MGRPTQLPGWIPTQTGGNAETGLRSHGHPRPQQGAVGHGHPGQLPSSQAQHSKGKLGTGCPRLRGDCPHRLPPTLNILFLGPRQQAGGGLRCASRGCWWRKDLDLWVRLPFQEQAGWGALQTWQPLGCFFK